MLTDRYPGFVNHYSTTGVEEDKAELFAIMIVAPDYIGERVQTDSVLRAKSKRMKILLQEFCPDMSDVFWNFIETGNHSDGE